MPQRGSTAKRGVVCHESQTRLRAAVAYDDGTGLELSALAHQLCSARSLNVAGQSEEMRV